METHRATLAKRVLVISNDEYFRTEVATAIATMPVTVAWASLSDAQRRMAMGEFDTILLDAGDQTIALLETIERLDSNATLEAASAAVLVRISEDRLKALQFPQRIHCDFILDCASEIELVTRLRFLLWPKETPAADEIISDGPLTIDTATYQVRSYGESLDLAYLEYALLVFLVTHANRAHSREELLRRVWGGQYYGGSRTVDVHVRRVRAKLDPESAERLETVRGMGYLWRTS